MQPFRVPLDSGTPPAAVVAGLAVEDHPAVLWGDGWFGGGVLIGLRPQRFGAGLGSAEAIELLADQPLLVEGDRTSDLVGGGWLGVVGFDDGTSMLGWYDSLLRWSPDGGWCFEALGLPGREQAYAAALADWRQRLAAPGAAPAWSCGEFATRIAPQKARNEHLAGVEETIRRIAAGDFYQLNLCTRLHAGFTGSAPAMFAAMAEQLQPVRGGLIATPEQTLASFSPELFLAVEPGSDGTRTVRSSPIKGTAPRRPGEQDSALRASAKDSAENIMILDLMRNDLARVAVPGTVRVDDLLALEPHPGVWHLVSTVSAQLAPTVDPAALLRATFPPGSVTGAPKSGALQGIAVIETEPRGAYTGAFGLSGPIRSEFNVVIRSFEIARDRIELGVGGGITTDSVPMLEWRECLHKAAPLITAARTRLAPGLDLPESSPTQVDPATGVFETMLAIDRRIPWLAEHLARLDRSCRELYRSGLPEALAAELHRDSAPGTGAEAVRVLARPEAGTLQVTVTRSPFAGGSTAGSAVTMPRPDGLWRHKWIDRAWLDRAEREAGDAFPLFVADDGVLLETSRGNLFLQREDGSWVTPPLRDDLLPGVTRRIVLERAPHLGVPIAIEPPRLDGRYRSAFWTSSLSGIVPITAIDDHSMAPLPPEVIALGNGLG
ncbi:bifunctional chorismate-binding protein/class IV aminotransferase [Enemella evansiae]|uniref:bifunctional chorismate-binding protein/class IV aminotransferase n=1 Tax=Enemella evansiae TaxID=2016499 RepID=UPI000B96A700|nr:chorismate-binding protein [Enemella evansiae]OYO01897.1 hypothetical protein CGZ97_15910 [Enemella evansiae]